MYYSFQRAFLLLLNARHGLKTSNTTKLRWKELDPFILNFWLIRSEPPLIMKRNSSVSSKIKTHPHQLEIPSHNKTIMGMKLSINLGMFTSDPTTNCQSFSSDCPSDYNHILDQFFSMHIHYLFKCLCTIVSYVLRR